MSRLYDAIDNETELDGMMTLVQRALTFGRMIKFSHSVFALPFAFVSGLIAWKTEQVTLTAVDVFLLVVCMVSARTAAMGFNRIADRDIDAINPRTKNREIPAGKVDLREAKIFTAIAVAIFIAASFGINTLCGLLSVPLLGLMESEDAEDVRRLMLQMWIEPVFTAHPTESTRRTILRKQQKIAQLLLKDGAEKDPVRVRQPIDQRRLGFVSDIASEGGERFFAGPCF